MKTVSLKLAKKLKANGYPQDAGLWYRIDKEDPNSEDVMLMNDPFESSRFDWCPSPTADEILAGLPCFVTNEQGFEHQIRIQKTEEEQWEIWYIYRWNDEDFLIGDEVFSDIFLADAAAKCWLYLKEKKLF